MKTLLSIILLCFALSGSSQAPFTTLIKEPRTLKVTQGRSGENVLVATDSIENTDYFRAKSNNPASRIFLKSKGLASENGVLLENTETETIVEPEQKDIDFFRNNVLSYSILNEGENRMTVSSQVLHYKLYIFDPTEQNTLALNRYNIPLLLIAKLSSGNDSQNTSTSVDVLDYEAAPLTLRIMPSWVLKSKYYTDALYFGFYADLRTLSVYDALADKNDMEVLGAGGIGFTYEGAGSAGIYNPNGEYEDGKYSLSVLFQGAGGNKSLIDRLFVTENEYVTSLQSYFLFKINENNKLNIKIGYQHFFQKTVAGTTNSFSIALGI